MAARWPTPRGQGGVYFGDLARFALHVGAEDEAVVALVLRLLLSGNGGDGIVGHDQGLCVVENGIARLGRIGQRPLTSRLQAPANAGGQAAGQIVALDHGPGVGPGAGVGHGGPGSDVVQGAANHVREQQGAHAGRIGQARASWPPLMREICLRTAFISWILAPQASSSRVVSCFSSSVTGSAGSGSSAEAPPEIRQINPGPRRVRRRPPRGDPRRKPRRRSGRARDAPHSFNSMRRSLARWPYLTLTSPQR